MPYEWTNQPLAAGGERSSPAALLRLWPHRSLPRVGFVGFIAGTAAFAGLPIVGMLGSPVLWVLLPFVLAAQTGIWCALRLSYRSGEVVEELRLWPDRLELVRSEPRRPVQRWESNPHWIQTGLHKTGGPVPNYLTLTAAGRTVEVGAFLSEDERLMLKPELEDALRRLH